MSLHQRTWVEDMKEMLLTTDGRSCFDPYHDNSGSKLWSTLEIEYYDVDEDFGSCSNPYKDSPESKVVEYP
ncbi:hypothetical protein A2U01_0031598 [Trifolium medium]|uniref:Uncharacterized protein n=1 Tax=Trifolium medium TaxID=97028 RepID=A0A392PHZ1_9FABA|nr:hypothetical protein [Trifolium medium]